MSQEKQFLFMKWCFEWCFIELIAFKRTATGTGQCTYNALMQISKSFLVHYVCEQAESSLATITNPVFGQHLLTIY